jgi:hypothetical protein
LQLFVIDFNNNLYHLIFLILSLLIITEVTLLFDDESLSAGLTLTVMLVMYTMYQSILESVTKTAYLKMIDYYLLFCLLVPFVIFLIEVYWYLKKSDPDNLKEKKIRLILDQVLKKPLVRIVVPIISSAFLMLYLLAAVTVMYHF